MTEIIKMSTENALGILIFMACMAAIFMPLAMSVWGRDWWRCGARKGDRNPPKENGL